MAPFLHALGPRQTGGLLLSFLVAASTPSPALAQFSGDGTLHKLNDPTGMAKCLDGSPMAYYHRAGEGNGANKWLLSYEGGGWCSNLEDCSYRTLGPLGSSSDYKSTTPLLLGKLTNDPDRNPTFYNWNIVYVKYCDGGFFSGDVLDPVMYEGEPLYFRGSYIHQVLVEDLLYFRGMAAATDVVVSGCSAGAVQTFINTDKIRGMLPGHMRVTGLPDSGFLVPYEGDGGCQYQESMASTFNLMNVASSLPQGCLDQFAETGDQWRCMYFAQYLVPHIKTPFFVVQSKYDFWQMDNNIYCEMLNVDGVRMFGKFFEDTFFATFNSLPRSGYLLDSCPHHCGGWDFIQSDDGLTQHDAFDLWYAAVFDDPTVNLATHRHNQAGLYPCLSCCVQGIWGDAHKEEVTTSLPFSTHQTLQHLQPRQLSSFKGEPFKHQRSIEQLVQMETEKGGKGQLLNKDHFLAIKDTMMMLREVGQFNAETAAVSLPIKHSMEIDADGGASMLPSDEEEKEDEEGTLRFFLRQVTEGVEDIGE